MRHFKFLRAVRIAIALICITPTSLFGHGNPLDIFVTNGKLATSTSLYYDLEDGFLIPQQDGSTYYADTLLPGFKITGMQNGDALQFRFLSRALASDPSDQRYLWYWNEGIPAGASINSATMTIDRTNLSSSATLTQGPLPGPTVLNVAEINESVEPILGLHKHMLAYSVNMNPATSLPDPGVYAFYGQFVSPQYQSSDPIWMLFNYNLSESQIEGPNGAVNAFLTQTVIPTSPSTVTWHKGSGIWNTVTGNWSGGSPTESLYKESDHVIFDNSAIGGTITIQAGGVSPSSTTVNNDNAHPYLIQNAGTAGIKTGSLAKSGSGTLTLDNINTYTGMTTVAGGLLSISQMGSIDNSSTINVNAAGALLTNHIRTTTLTIDGSATIRADGGESGASKVETFTIGAGGKLNLKDNDLVVGSDAVEAVRAQIKIGVGGTNGITSDTANFGVTTGFGYAAGNDANLSPLLSGMLSGQTYSANSVLIKYTFLGDADLDGDSDLNDLGLWAQSFTGDLGNPAIPATVWTSGDFDYDGDTDLNDLGFWAGTFTGDLGGGAGSLIVNAPGASIEAVAILNQMGITVVPEPSMVGAIGFFAATAMLAFKKNLRRLR